MVSNRVCTSGEGVNSTGSSNVRPRPGNGSQIDSLCRRKSSPRRRIAGGFTDGFWVRGWNDLSEHDVRDITLSWVRPGRKRSWCGAPAIGALIATIILVGRWLTPSYVVGM